MMQRVLISVLLLTAGLTPAAAATLTVNITDVEDIDGVVRIAVCDRKHFTEAQCAYKGSAPANADGQASVTIHDIPPGVYAVQAYADTNNNDRLDTNWIGWPKEGMGFSNDAQMHHGPPSYDDAAIKLSEPGGTIRFSMQYF